MDEDQIALIKSEIDRLKFREEQYEGRIEELRAQRWKLECELNSASFNATPYGPAVIEEGPRIIGKESSQ